MSNLRIKQLTKKYGNLTVLDKFSLDINSGEFMVLLGPSGCGKTTVLRCIAGLVNPSDGEIYIGGRLVNDLPPKDRDIAMVFQNYSLYPHMNVFENIAFPLKMRHTSKNRIDENVKRIADLLGIKELLQRKPKELSGGQMQRVALGRALVREPKVFLLDEPLSNLDAKLRMDMRVEIKKLQREVGITTLYITHDQIEAMSMADNIAVMNQSKLQQLGSPDIVYNQPENVFVAGFIGTPPMNFIECKVVIENSEMLLDSSIAGQDNNNRLQLKADSANAFSHSESITIGVRPKDVYLLEDDQKFQGIVIPARISFIELLGDDSIVEVNVGSKTVRISSVTSNYSNLAIGKEIKIGIKFAKIHLFSNTGDKISRDSWKVV